MSCSTKQSNLTISADSIRVIPGFPNGEAGYDLGVSACYAGTHDGMLVMAGGCNFPEPGHKKYYDGIYIAQPSSDSLVWKQVGHLPEPAAYGACISTPDSLLFIGGNNADHSLRSAYSLRHIEGEWVLHRLPNLPVTIDNFTACALGNQVFVFGGNQDGLASDALFFIDLDRDSPSWSLLGHCPGGPRMQPVSVAANGLIYFWGGFHACGEQSVVYTDGLCYDILSATWSPLPSPLDNEGLPVTLLGGCALMLDHDHILCAGGVNRDIFLDAISGRYQLVAQPDYLKQPIEWYRFNNHLLIFDIRSHSWLTRSTVHQAFARAGAQTIIAGDYIYYIGGELKPSVRTAEIILMAI